MIKLITATISLWLIVAFSFAQNWDSLGRGTNSSVRFLFTDTINNKLLIGKQSMGSGFNCFNVWNGSSIDTLGFVDNTGYSINKFQNDIIIAEGNIIKWDGMNWTPLGGGVNSNATVFGLYNNNNNFLYATGAFDTVGGIPASRVAKWNGTNWSAIDTTKFIGGAARCAIMYNGELYIGGNFFNSTGTISRIAKWNGATWQPLGTGIIGSLEEVFAFDIYQNKLIVAGYFNTANGNPGNCIATWDGTQWGDLGGGLTSFAAVISIKVHNNELYAAGTFGFAGGVPANNIAKWDGTNWCSLGATFDNIINSIEFYNDTLYIGGGFWTINGDSINYIAKWIGGSFVDTCGNLTSITQPTSNQQPITIYPNPTTGIFTINTEGIKINQLKIYNIIGEIIQPTSSLSLLKGNASLDFSEQPNGIYFVQIETDKTTFNKKIIKQ
jgi:hypothetical protein